MTGKVVPLNQPFPEQRPDQVTTFDLLSTSSLGWRANPDTLVGQRGLAIYSKMADDEQVKAVLNFKRDAITARGWQFVFDDTTSLTEKEQTLRTQLFQKILTSMRGAFSDALNAIMTGRAYGFSITEKIYGQLEFNGKTWPAINLLMGRDPLSFRFYTDEYGVLNKIEQQTHRSGTKEVDQRRVIHYVHSPEWDHVYGRSDLREAYRPWYIKQQINNLWPLYLERFAGGFLHASMGPEASLTAAETEALDEALKKAKALGAIRTPPGVTLSVIHPPAGGDQYKSALEFHDLAIAKALLVPNLLGISHTGGVGAYAQSQTQLEAFFWTLNADATRLEECLNEQLFRDLGDQCWGDGEYPMFKFRPASLEHAKWLVATWASMIGAGAVIPTVSDEKFLRKMLDMPEREEGDKTLAQENADLAPAPPQPAPGAEGGVGTDIAGASDEGEGGTSAAAEDDAEDDDEGEKRKPVGKGQLKEFARRPTSRLTRVIFTTPEERDAWISALRPLDEIVTGAALVFDEADDPPASSTAAELEVLLDEPTLALPLHAALTVQKVEGTRVVVKYDGRTR